MKVSNQSCIRTLSRKSLRAARLRNGIAILAIALTTVLFTSLFTIAASINYSFEQQSFRMAGGDMHGSFKDITWEQAEQLRADPLVKESGARLMLGMPTQEPFNKSHVEVSYMEPGAARHYFCSPTEGSLPQEGTNQAATDTRVLALLGIEPQVGAEFTLTYELGSNTGNPTPVTQSFVLSGWWEYDEAVVASHVILPLSRAEETLVGYTRQGDTDSTGAWSLDVLFSHSLQIEENMQTVLANCGYQSEQPAAENYIAIGVNWGYSGAQLSQNIDPVTLGAIAALLLLIGFTGYLIIYNVFQISVTNDIRFYGLLKTIGTTGRQLRRIVRRQALALSLLGIPIGLALGFLIGNRLTPVIMEQLVYKTAFVSFNPLIFVGAALFSLITVLISCRRPGRMAARVSPIEAVRYTEGAGKPPRRWARRAGQKGASLFSMALGNLGRNRTKTALVIVSLSLAVVLLNLTVTFTGGFDMDKYLQSRVVTDFIVGHADYFQSASGGGFHSTDQAMEESVIDAIDAQGGIAESGRIYGQTTAIQQFISEDWYRQSYSLFYDEAALEQRIATAERGPDGQILDRAQLYGMEELPLRYLTVVEGDLSKLTDPSGRYIAAVYSQDDYGVPKQDSHWAKVGDTVTLRYVEEVEYYDPATGETLTPEQVDRFAGSPGWRATAYREVSYEVAACVTIPQNEGYRFYGADQFVLGAEAFQRDSGTSDVMSYLLNMQDDAADAQMLAFLEEYTTTVQTAYDFESKQDYIAEFEGMRSMFLTLGGALSAIVGLVGALNFVNAVLTGIITRRREFAVLGAIGMTGRQLRRMLMLEGLLYTLGAVLASLALSLVMGPVVGSALSGMFWFFSYRVTVLPILLIAPVFVALGLCIPWLAYHAAARHTIVERLREAE